MFYSERRKIAAIYDSSNIAEAVESCVISDSVATSIQDVEYVDVYRFRSTTGKGLDDPGYGAQPIIQRINDYVSQKDRYAYEEIVFLAFLTVTRRLPIVDLIEIGRLA